MFKKDLVAKYGDARDSYYSPTDVALRKALRFRALVFGGGGIVLTALCVLGAIYLPEAFFMTMLAVLTIGGVMALWFFIVWLVQEFPEYLRTIKKAKRYGVKEVNK